MGVEGGMMSLRQRNTVGYHRMPERFVSVLDDMRGIEQQRLRQAGEGASAAVRRDDGFPERRLMQPLLDHPQRVAALRGGLGRSRGIPLRESEGDAGLKAARVPSHDIGRSACPVSSGSDAEEV